MNQLQREFHYIRKFGPWVLALLLLIFGWSVWNLYAPEDAFEPPDSVSHQLRRVSVSHRSETTMKPLTVEPPQEERWRDIGDNLYDEEFRRSFDYADTDRCRVEVEYQREADTLRGTLHAQGLKPRFLYQIKLVGLEPVLGADEASNAHERRAWSSWQLGRLGRWWCEDCDWNVPDAELESHVADGHAVRGYLLFDWFGTDPSGDADVRFKVDRSLHVVWLLNQRDREDNDEPARYAVTEHPHRHQTTMRWPAYGEWEPDRPKIGELTLPPGAYEVGLNLTEESFHANMDEERTSDGGGFWAWVLQSDVSFLVRHE